MIGLGTRPAMEAHGGAVRHGALGPSGPGLKVGDRVLLVVPESGVFSYHFVMLTVCGGGNGIGKD